MYVCMHTCIFKCTYTYAYIQQAKICVQCPTEAEMIEINAKAQERGLVTYLVCDAGRTQIPAGSRTVLAIGPAPESTFRGLTDHFKLLWYGYEAKVTAFLQLFKDLSKVQGYCRWDFVKTWSIVCLLQKIVTLWYSKFGFAVSSSYQKQ